RQVIPVSRAGYAACPRQVRAAIGGIVGCYYHLPRQQALYTDVPLINVRVLCCLRAQVVPVIESPLRQWSVLSALCRRKSSRERIVQRSVLILIVVLCKE